MTLFLNLQLRAVLRTCCVGLMMLVGLSSGIAQTKPPARPPSPAKACLTAQQVKTIDLYGQWSVEFSNPPRGLPAKATLQLQRHAEYSESLAGTLLRDFSAVPGGKVPDHSPRAQVAGDLEGVMFMLDESSNGTNLTAGWDGKIVEGSCGEIIQGVWKDLSSDAAPEAVDVPFTMRQTSGW